MASPLTSEIEEKFTQVENSINSVLDVPILLLTERKRAMLSEVASLREEYCRIKSDKESSLEDLKNSKEELICIASLMKENQAQSELDKAIHNLDERIATLELETPNPPKIEFTHSLSHLKQIEELISSFGKVGCEDSSKIETTSLCQNPPQKETKPDSSAEKEPVQSKKTDPSLKARDYSTIKSPQTKLAKFGKGEGEFLDPGCLCLDEDNERIYLCDGGNGRIQVWSIHGEYLSEFGSTYLVSPVGIVICMGAIFITDFLKKTVFKFNHSNYSYVDRGSRFNFPHGLDSDDHEIFVPEPFKHRVLVLTPELEHLRTLGVGVLKRCYSIKVREGVLYAMEYSTNTIKLLNSQTGKLIRSIATNKDEESLFNVTFFSMDLFGNFFLTDMVADKLKILSPDGDTITIVSFKNWKSHEPKGVVVLSVKKLLIGFAEGENSILIL